MAEYNESESLLPEPTGFDHILRSLEAASSVLGPVATSAIRGFMTPRRLGRLEAAIKVFDAEFLSLVDEIAEDYVASEEFEDLAIEAFERIVRERDDEKVRIYGRILAGMAAAPDKQYDLKLDVLRAVEQLHPIHIRMIRVCWWAPTEQVSYSSGITSHLETLQNRLQEPDRVQVEEAIKRLQDLRIFDESAGWPTQTSDSPGVDFRTVFTRFGESFVSFLARQSD